MLVWHSCKNTFEQFSNDDQASCNMPEASKQACKLVFFSW